MFPDASTTGVPVGTSLTPHSGDMTINTAGAVISGLDITGDVVVTASDVTFVNCRITGSIFVTGINCTIEYCDIVGKNTTNSVDIEGNNAIVRFCDISGSENGIWLEADGCLIEENYIHNLFSNNGNPDPHIDGIQIPGSNIGAATTENAVIRHNNIDLDNNTANACITMMDGINVDIINNRFNGGSYVIYFEGASQNCDVLNNTFNQYTYGYVSGASWQNQTYSGNINEVTGGGILGGSTPPDTTAPDAPVFTLFADDTGVQGDGHTTDTTLVLSGTAEAGSHVTIYDNSLQIGTATAQASGAWSFFTSVLTVATHSFTATASDLAGNVSAVSAPLSVTIDAAPPPPPVGQTITGTSSHDSLFGGDGSDNISGKGGQDLILGMGGNDSIHGDGGADYLNGGAGADTIWGGSGNDHFIFHAGEANGDVVMDFVGNGQRTGDVILFDGYGTKAEGATFARLDTTHWQVNSADGSIHETITFANGANIHQLDYMFI